MRNTRKLSNNILKILTKMYLWINIYQVLTLKICSDQYYLLNFQYSWNLKEHNRNVFRSCMRSKEFLSFFSWLINLIFHEKQFWFDFSSYNRIECYHKQIWRVIEQKVVHSEIFVSLFKDDRMHANRQYCIIFPDCFV